MCHLLSNSPFAALHFNNLSPPDAVETRTVWYLTDRATEMLGFCFVTTHWSPDGRFDGRRDQRAIQLILRPAAIVNISYWLWFSRWQFMMACWMVFLTRSMMISLWSLFCSHLYQQAEWLLFTIWYIHCHHLPFKMWLNWPIGAALHRHTPGAVYARFPVSERNILS